VEATSLISFAALGVLGSAHCAGMCGGFSLAISMASQESRKQLVLHQAAYIMGKAVTYALLGVAAALATHAASHGTSSDGEFLLIARRGFAWLAGTTMVFFGIRAAGIRLALPAFTTGALAWAGVQRVFQGMRRLPGYAGPLGVGLMTGLLPCGLSWSALALGAGSRPAEAALGLLVFGLATAPALLAVGLGWRGLSVRARHVALRIAGPVLVVFGVLTVLRGGDPFGAGAEVLPACCVGDQATPL